MPKTKNLGKLKDRFEVRGGIINEFDFHQGQREFAEEERNRLEQREQGPPEGEGQPQSEAERIAQLMEDAHQKAEANLRRREKREGKSPSKAAGAGKKRAARKSATGGAKKSAAKRSAVKKSTAKKAAAKKLSAPRRGAAKKSGGKKSAAGKSGTKKGGAKKGGAKKSGARRAGR